MTENDKKNSNSKTLSLRGTGSSVRMNLSHGRSKSVLIETKRKKIILPNKNKLSLKESEINSNKTGVVKENVEKVFSDEQIDRRKKAIEAAREREILLKEEQEKLNSLLEHTKAMADLYCTGCGYCMPCPHEVNIPARFDAMNAHKVYGLTEHAKNRYRQITNNDGKCVECGSCVPKCPQHIKIVEQLKETELALKSD